MDSPSGFHPADRNKIMSLLVLLLEDESPAGRIGRVEELMAVPFHPRPSGGVAVFYAELLMKRIGI